MGKLASAWETLTGRNPKQAVVENLRHFKAFAETGEIPRTQGQPHGPRGVVGSMKASAYGEKIRPRPRPNAKSARPRIKPECLRRNKALHTRNGDEL
ncbi:MAG: hypothetical protein QOK38_1285 [Acidobacteriaceae bacterium]|nr:hypothetical protein [Acidobacteriaceae bacterium]